MRIIQLTPGTGNFYCGSCLRDNTLVRGLRARGHDAIMVPLYLPHVLDEPAESAGVPIFLSGISVFLDQKYPKLRRPAWLDRVLSSPRLLKRAANLAGMTSAKDLGESTVSMLKGKDGCQANELDRLIEWLRTQPKPDIFCLSNSLLSGLALRLKEEFRVPVVSSFQGEDSFLDALFEPYRKKSWELLAARCAEVDHFISVSRYFASEMKRRLGLSGDIVSIAYPGIAADEFSVAAEPPSPSAIGYLARMHHAKGLGTLVDAFIELKKRNRVPDFRLRIAGAMTNTDTRFVDSLRDKLSSRGLLASVDFLPNISREAKHEFFRTLSVFSVPATYGEAFGFYVLESLAAGVPVVQPRHAAFPEILEQTGGGLLCEPDDVASLADKLESLLLDAPRARALGAKGRAAVREKFTIEQMITSTEENLSDVVARKR